MPIMATDKRTQGSKKNDSKRRSLKTNGERPAEQGLPGHEQDPKRRLGNFTGTGEHARQGGREARG